MGKEYQAVGLDAVLLMEHANLPQLPGAIPVVKCSADNLHQTVMELVQEGVSVVSSWAEISTSMAKCGYGWWVRATHCYVSYMQM